MPARVIPPRNKKAPNAIWHYEQPGFTRPIEGHSLDNLIENVLQFRLDNDLEVGDPENDVENYARSKWPHLYRHKAGDQPITVLPTLPRQVRTPLDEIRLKNKLWKKGKFSLVDPAIATDRGLVCAACPSNVKVNEITMCGPCVAPLTRDSTILTKNKNAGPDLHFCKSLEHDNRTAVWMPDERLQRSMEKLADAPAECWLREVPPA